jgi:hypothetical protein
MGQAALRTVDVDDVADDDIGVTQDEELLEILGKGAKTR